MTYQYRGLERIDGPLIFLSNTHDIANEEMVKVRGPDGEFRMGRVLELSKEVVTIEVFQGTSGLALEHTEVEFLERTLKIGVSKGMLGRVFNGLGDPIDFYEENHEKKPPILPTRELSINGSPINPWAREYPKDVIITGISAIDGLNSLIRGQKLPIFSGQGLPHNKIAAQIVRQARVLTKEPFVVVFCGIGILQDDAIFFQRSFEETGAIQNVVSVINLAEDPTVERLVAPRVALTIAEYLAFTESMHVLVVMLDITNYAEALREISSSKGEIPSRKGFPGYMYSDFASLYERAGRIKGVKGSVTLIPIISMPNDDITHPIPDLTGYITEGQIVLSRNLHHQGIYPPAEVLSSLSRLMKEGVGEKQTRGDHMDVSSQLYALYSESLHVRELESIIGYESLSNIDRKILQFGKDFETLFLNQGDQEDRSIEETFNIAWDIMSKIPRRNLIRVNEKWLDLYYKAKK
ncbi:MAG: V-type ATP synthase subunit B [Promethearchaeota archaeon]